MNLEEQYLILDTLRPITQQQMDDIMKNTKDTTQESIDDVLDERGSRYGRFIDHAKITQELKRALFRHMDNISKVECDADQLEALEMICHKIGRIVNGDPDYVDSWVDIAGYAKLVADRLQGTIR